MAKRVYKRIAMGAARMLEKKGFYFKRTVKSVTKDREDDGGTVTMYHIELFDRAGKKIDGGWCYECGVKKKLRRAEEDMARLYISRETGLI